MGGNGGEGGGEWKWEVEKAGWKDGRMEGWNLCVERVAGAGGVKW